MENKVIEKINAEINFLKEVMAKEEAELKEYLAKANKAISAAKPIEYAELKATLQNIVKCINAHKTNLLYCEMALQEKPLEFAIRKMFYTTLNLAEKRNAETKTLAEVKAVEKNNTRINVKAFVLWVNDLVGSEVIPSGWIIDSNKLLALLQVRKTSLFELDEANLINQTAAYVQAARAKREGKTPDSNRAIVTLIQKIFDATIYTDNGKGLNVYKATVKDLQFIDDATYRYARSQAAGIRSCSTDEFTFVMASVLHTELIQGGYKVINAKHDALKEVLANK